VAVVSPIIVGLLVAHLFQGGLADEGSRVFDVPGLLATCGQCVDVWPAPIATVFLVVPPAYLGNSEIRTLPEYTSPSSYEDRTTAETRRDREWI
jgi:hypothetical protein